MEKDFSIKIQTEADYYEALSYLKLQGLKVNEGWCRIMLRVFSRIASPTTLYLTLKNEWVDEFELYTVNHVNETYSLDEYIKANPLPIGVYEKDKYKIGDLVVSQVPGERIVLLVSEINDNLSLISGSIVLTTSPTHSIGSYMPRVSMKTIRKYYGVITLKSTINEI